MADMQQQLHIAQARSKQTQDSVQQTQDLPMQAQSSSGTSRCNTFWHTWGRWALVVLWAALIFFMSAHSGSQMDSGILGSIKVFLANAICSIIGPCDDPVSPVGHFCEYTIFGILLAYAFHGRLTWKYALICAIVVASCYGVTDEIHQLFVPGRMCDPADWATDTCGATLGAFICFAFAMLCRHRVETS